MPVTKADLTRSKRSDLVLVCDQHDSHSVAIEPLQQFHHFEAGVGVQRPSGFVGENQHRVVH